MFVVNLEILLKLEGPVCLFSRAAAKLNRSKGDGVVDGGHKREGQKVRTHWELQQSDY